MKLCFINPPIEDFYSTSIRRQPLGLLYVMAAVKNEGHETVLVNGHSPRSRVMELPAGFGYLRPFMEHPDPMKRFPFRHYSHFGTSFQEMRRQLKDIRADAFFVSSLFTTYHEETASTISIVRETNPGAVIIAGGYHAALYPSCFLKELCVDFVITGEGEETAVLLCRHLQGRLPASDIPGLAFISEGEITYTAKRPVENIDTLSFPAREFLRERDFSMYRKRAVSMLTSRGCPHRCRFCTGRTIWGNTYRTRDTGSVIREIRLCAQNYGVNIINFEDDNLLAIHSRSRELLGKLASCRREINGGLEFTAMNGISIENCDEDILVLMKEAGFNEINLSLVTASEELQNRYGRPFDTSRFRETVDISRRLELRVRAYFILGLPDQTAEEIEATISMLEECGVSIFPSVYYDVNAPMEQWKMQRSSAFFNETPHLKREDLIYFFNRAMAGRGGR